MGINTGLSDSFATDKWMNRRKGQVTGPQLQSDPGARTASHFGYQPQPSPEELANLRRQQAAQHAGEVEVDRQNTWMLVPVVAPELVGLAAEGAFFFAGRAAAKRLKALPEMALNREKFGRTGNFWEVRVGRRFHKEFGAKVRAKADEGWRSEEALEGASGKTVKPDALTPPRQTSPNGRFLEVKPDTPSGRKAGAAALKRYERETGLRGRVVYYDPKGRQP